MTLAEIACRDLIVLGSPQFMSEYGAPTNLILLRNYTSSKLLPILYFGKLAPPLQSNTHSLYPQRRLS
jgi:hypothetical protein